MGSIEDPILGEREIDLTAPDALVQIVRDQKKLLETLRNQGQGADSIDHDIETYRIILESDDPVKFADIYFNAKDQIRRDQQRGVIAASEVAKHLGWLCRVRLKTL